MELADDLDVLGRRIFPDFSQLLWNRKALPLPTLDEPSLAENEPIL